MAKQPSNDVIFVGCDDGHDSIKLVMRSLTDKAESGKLTMPSKVGRGNRVISLTGDGVTGGVYQAGDEVFTVTDALAGGDLIDTRTINYPISAINRILVHDALIRAKLSGKNVHLVTGLPVQDYYIPGDRDIKSNTDLIEKKKSSIATGDIHSLAGTPTANIVGQAVACEGLAAIYDMAINDDGSDNMDFLKLIMDHGPVGVIDIGGKTIDLAVANIERGVLGIEKSRTQSIDFGMLRVVEGVRKEIQIAYKTDDITPRVMAQVMSERKMSIYGQHRSMEAEIATALAKVAPDIFDRIRAHWKNATDLSSVIIVGGGAYALAQAIKDGLYTHAAMRPEPEYANARGMLKMGMRSYIQSQAQ